MDEVRSTADYNQLFKIRTKLNLVNKSDYIDIINSIILYRMQYYMLLDAVDDSDVDGLLDVVSDRLRDSQLRNIDRVVFGGLPLIKSFMGDLADTILDIKAFPASKYTRLSYNELANMSWSYFYFLSESADHDLIYKSDVLTHKARSLGYMSKSRNSVLDMFLLFDLLFVDNCYVKSCFPVIYSDVSIYRFNSTFDNAVFDPRLPLFPHVFDDMIDREFHYQFIMLVKDEILPERSFLKMLLDKSYDLYFYDIFSLNYTRMMRYLSNNSESIDNVVEDSLSFILKYHYYRSFNNSVKYHTIPILEYIIGSKCFSDFNEWFDSKLGDTEWVLNFIDRFYSDFNIYIDKDDLVNFILPVELFTPISMSDRFELYRKIDKESAGAISDWIFDQDGDLSGITCHISYNQAVSAADFDFI